MNDKAGVSVETEFWSVQNNNLVYSGVSSPESGSKAASAASPDDVSVSPPVSAVSDLVNWSFQAT